MVNISFIFKIIEFTIICSANTSKYPPILICTYDAMVVSIIIHILTYE